VTFLKAWPEAHLNEMAIFIYNEGGPLYPITVISKRLDELKITKKSASTEAYQAQREDVQFGVWSFWNCPSPLGIFSVPQRKLIDVDEFGISLEMCNRTGGWVLRAFRVREDGHYHQGAKIIVLFAIEPGSSSSAARPWECSASSALGPVCPWSLHNNQHLQGFLRSYLLGDRAVWSGWGQMTTGS
jgi:hypothetical protein